MTFQSQRAVSGLVVVLSVLTIALGVAVMEVSISLATGFKTEIQEKVVGFGSHIQIGYYLANLDYSQKPIDNGPENDFVKPVQGLPGVQSVSPYVAKTSMLKSEETLEGVLLKGVDSTYDWRYFEEVLVAGRLPELNQPKEVREILISQKLADVLMLEVEDDARVYFFQDPPRVRKVEVVGIYETGMEEFDKVTVFCDMRMLQRIMKWEENEVAGYEVRLDDVETLDAQKAAINDLLPYDLNATTIIELYPDIFDWLDLQQQNVLFILVLMIIIAIINMTSVILILILERTRTIGLLKSMGLPNPSVMGIFLVYAFFLILVGVILGNLLGLGLIFSQDTWEWVSLNEENYFVKVVPVQWAWLEFLLINVGVVIICTLFMIFPTLAVLNITPVKALRFD
jgi:lipoprotein-releasing system permease protein